MILRLRNLDHAALLKELGHTLRCLKLSDVVPVVRMIRGHSGLASICSLSSFSGLVSLFICRLAIGRVNNINSHARRRVPQVPVLHALILRAPR